MKPVGLATKIPDEFSEIIFALVYDVKGFRRKGGEEHRRRRSDRPPSSDDENSCVPSHFTKLGRSMKQIGLELRAVSHQHNRVEHTWTH